MFDFSFTELLLMLVVALVVIGPERLPRVARTMGYWVGRARAVFNSVKKDVEREARLDEIKDAERDFRRAEREFRRDLDPGLNEDATKPPGQGRRGSGASPRRSIADDSEPAGGRTDTEGSDPTNDRRGDDGNT